MCVFKSVYKVNFQCFSLIMYKCAKTETSLDTLDGYEKIETVKNTSTSNLR